MPFYNQLRFILKKSEERKRTVENLIRLRNQLDTLVPSKDAEDNLLIATWNIRDFGKPVKKRRGRGPRLPES